MSTKRMSDLVSKYRAYPGYVYRILTYDEIGMCDESLQAGFRISMHLFIKRLLILHGLVPTQIHPHVWWAINSFLIKCAEVSYEP